MARQLFRQEAIDAQREKFLGEATIARPVPFWVFTTLAAGVALPRPPSPFRPLPAPARGRPPPPHRLCCGATIPPPRTRGGLPRPRHWCRPRLEPRSRPYYRTAGEGRRRGPRGRPHGAHLA